MSEPSREPSMTTFFPSRPAHLRRKLADNDYPLWPPLDTLYDYTQILSQTSPIAVIPQQYWGTEVAIIGAGPAGMVAAFEALRMGLTPVVFEASPHRRAQLVGADERLRCVRRDGRDAVSALGARVLV